MKKSFILSLVMVVVLIASLATATYAWYTAQLNVNTTAVEATTAGAGKSIVISAQLIDDVNYSNKVVTLTAGAGSDEIAPMSLLGTPTASSGLDSFTFKTFTLDNMDKINGVADSEGLTLGSVTDVNNTAKTNTANIIYVANPGATAGTYTVKVIITDTEANDGLRVAIFKKANPAGIATDDAGEFTLLGIWVPENESVSCVNDLATNGVQYSHATSGLAAGESKLDDSDPLVYESGDTADAGTLAAVDNNVIDNDAYAVMYWFEGDKISNAFQGKTASFQIYFDMAA